jgi:hypothetical protein
MDPAMDQMFLNEGQRAWQGHQKKYDGRPITPKVFFINESYRIELEYIHEKGLIHRAY